MTPRAPTARAWPWAAALVLGLVAAGLLAAWLLRATSARLLHRDAEHTALAWAQLASDSIDDLEPLLAGVPPSEAARRDLLRYRHVQEVFRFKLFDRQGRPVLVSDDLDRTTPEAPLSNTIGHGNPVVRDLVLGGKPVVELKAGQDESRPAVYSEAYVPLHRQGRMIGVVEVYVDQTERARRIRSAFGVIAATVFTLLGLLGAGLAAWWWQRSRAAQKAADQARYLAEHDTLSGLLNRNSFHQALREAAWRQAAGGPGFALLCVDLDHFKDINEAQGHAAGDELLRQVGDRLRELVRQGDRVARLAGDEFAILLGGGGSAEAASALAQRVIAALAEPYQLPGGPVSCGCCIGAARPGGEAATPEAVLQQAGLALQRAKRLGRGGFSFYDEALDRQFVDRRRLAADLRAALGTSQLFLHFQPLVGADGHTVTGYESLLRWQHPERGLVPPAEFIPLAEESGDIEALGRWVLVEACRTAAGWPDGLSVAVNLSAAQFRRGDVVADVRAALATSGLPATRLELEITESLLMGHAEAALAALGAMAGLGVRIAMDDFGTGYSSLAYLWRFPVHKLKIDRAFTQHLDHDPKVQLIVRSIISLAHAMAIRVNAEGVETPEQLQALMAQGCDEFQGYLLGRPAPPEALAQEPAATPPQSTAWRATAPDVQDLPGTRPEPPPRPGAAEWQRTRMTGTP